MQNVQGLALVASPHLSDPNFLKSVVYILRHDDEGALGLILNRPTSTNVGDLLGQLSEQSLCNEAAVFCGGPVDGPLVMLQRIEMGDEVLIAAASDQESILNTCEDQGVVRDYRVFDGYAGWGAGQLESELSQGGWIVWELSPDDIFSEPETVWQRAIQEIGKDILSGSIDPSLIPEDPAFN